MDKYEYRLKMEQIRKLARQEDFTTAKKIADSMDFRRVKDARILCMISNIYEKNGQLDRARNLLLQAYEYTAIGRQVLYHLIELAISTGRLDDAGDYIQEYKQIAPRDKTILLLEYQLQVGKKAAPEKLIPLLKAYVQNDMDEKWAVELAKLYDRAGEKEACVSICDEIIMMFAFGDYVEEAMQIKQKYVPLTPFQRDKLENKEKYEQRFIALKKESTQEALQEESKTAQAEETAKEPEPAEEPEAQSQEEPEAAQAEEAAKEMAKEPEPAEEPEAQSQKEPEAAQAEEAAKEPKPVQEPEAAHTEETAEEPEPAEEPEAQSQKEPEAVQTEETVKEPEISEIQGDVSPYQEEIPLENANSEAVLKMPEMQEENLLTEEEKKKLELDRLEAEVILELEAEAEAAKKRLREFRQAEENARRAALEAEQDVVESMRMLALARGEVPLQKAEPDEGGAGEADQTAEPTDFYQKENREESIVSELPSIAENPEGEEALKEETGEAVLKEVYSLLGKVNLDAFKEEDPVPTAVEVVENTDEVIEKSAQLEAEALPKTSLVGKLKLLFSGGKGAEGNLIEEKAEEKSETLSEPAQEMPSPEDMKGNEEEVRGEIQEGGISPKEEPAENTAVMEPPFVHEASRPEEPAFQQASPEMPEETKKEGPSESVSVQQEQNQLPEEKQQKRKRETKSWKKTNGEWNFIVRYDNEQEGIAYALTLLKKMPEGAGRPRQIAKVEAGKVNEIGIAGLKAHLENRVLMIVHAEQLSENVCQELKRLDFKDKKPVMVVLLGDSKKMERFFSENSNLNQKIEKNLYYKEYSPTELTTYTIAYAKEREAVFEDMALLALDEKIALKLQRGVNLQQLDMEGLVDYAIGRATRFSIKKIASEITGSRYDDEGYLILREQDIR